MIIRTNIYIVLIRCHALCYVQQPCERGSDFSPITQIRKQRGGTKGPHSYLTVSEPQVCKNSSADSCPFPSFFDQCLNQWLQILSSVDQDWREAAGKDTFLRGRGNVMHLGQRIVQTDDMMLRQDLTYTFLSQRRLLRKQPHPQHCLKGQLQMTM